jgi:pilus assembly protein CpaB
VEERHIPASDVEQIIGANATEAVKANESLLWTDMAVLQAGSRRLSDLVQEGMRAITVRNRTGAFGGLLRPGDRVDLLFTEGGKFGENEARATSTLLQNLLVLAVGSNLGGSEQGDRPEGVATGRVTLGVTAEQGQLIAQAEHQGQLRLVLRNPDDIVLLEDLPETAAGDVTGISDRSRWSLRQRVAGTTREIEHVR